MKGAFIDLWCMLMIFSLMSPNFGWHARWNLPKYFFAIDGPFSTFFARQLCHFMAMKLP